MKRLACAVLVALPLACSFSLDPSTTPGVAGRAQFSYASTLFGSATSVPMMHGTTERLSARGALPAVTVTSSDPSIVSVSSQSDVTCCTQSGSTTSCTSPPPGSWCPTGSDVTVTVGIEASRVGTARISLVDVNSKEIDATVLSVAPAASLSLACSEKPEATIAAGKTCIPRWTASDANGHALQATRGVHLVSADSTVAGFSGGLSLDPPAPSAEGDQSLFGTTLVGIGPGDTVVTGTTSGGVAATMKVHVTP